MPPKRQRSTKAKGGPPTSQRPQKQSTAGAKTKKGEDLSQTTIKAQKRNHLENETEEHLNPVISSEKSKRSRSKSKPSKKNAAVAAEDNDISIQVDSHPNSNPNSISASDAEEKKPISKRGRPKKEKDHDHHHQQQQQQSPSKTDTPPDTDLALDKPTNTQRLLRHRLALTAALLSMLVIWILARGIEGFELGWKKLVGKWEEGSRWK